jgi:peptidoglycan/LPS O-acetylase OafA/YrhL
MKKTPTWTTDATAPPRLRGLDGLRAIAVTTVIAFHLTPGVLPGGYVGVDIFFVISGFLITTLLLREHALTGRVVLHSFWVRRARRLLPALALVVLASCTTAFLLGGDVLVSIGRQVLGAATFSYNWVAIATEASYFDSTTPELFRNLWSLAVEEQFYLVWPFAIVALVLFRRVGWRIAIITLLALGSISAMVALSIAGADPTRIYYGTDTHSFGLAIGALLAVTTLNWSPRRLEWRRSSARIVPVLGFLAVAGLLALSGYLAEDSELVFRGGLVLVAVLTAFAIAGAVVPGSLLGRLLDLAPLRVIGERSYGLYLWHWPVFILVSAAWPAFDPWLIGGMALAITVVLAVLSYRFVEQPVRRRGFGSVARSWARSWAGGPLRFARVFLASIVAIGLMGGGYFAITTAPTAGVAQEAVEAGQAAIDRQPRPQADQRAPGEPAPLPGGDQIYAIGDSVMLAAADEVLTTFPGIVIDASVSRRMSDAPPIVQSLVDAGSLRPILLLGLGTNGPVDQSSIDQVMAIAGPDTEVVLVNAQAPRGWIPGVNELLASYAQSHRNVELANWYDAIQPRLDVLSRDKIHAGGPIGGQIYADALRDAIQRLAELPPLLNPNDYGLSARPA